MAHVVYMLASRRHGTLYVGVTNDIARRTFAHKANVVGGFTTKNGVDQLVWYEPYDQVEEVNPNWLDLFATLNP